MSTLFDPDDYKSPQDSGREPRVPRGRRRYGPKPGISQTDDENWWVIAKVAEPPLGGVHRIAETLKLGSVITECGQVGRPLQRLSTGTDAYLCKDCKS